MTKKTFIARSIVLLSLAAAALAAFAPASLGQKGGDEPGPNRARWEKLPAEEKRRLLENYEKMTSRRPAEVERAAERHRVFEELKAAALARLSAEERSELDALSPRIRIEKIQRLVEGLRRERRSALEGKVLPPELREEIGKLPPRERLDRLREARPRIDEFRQAGFVDRLVREGRLEAAEADAIRQAPPAERARRVRALRDAEEDRADLAFIDRLEKSQRLESGVAERLRAAARADRRRALGETRKRLFIEDEGEALRRLPSRVRERLLSLPAPEFLREARRLVPQPPSRRRGGARPPAPEGLERRPAKRPGGAPHDAGDGEVPPRRKGDV